MSDTVVIGNVPDTFKNSGYDDTALNLPKTSSGPDILYPELKRRFDEAGLLIDDIILKKYLYSLTELELLPLDKNLQKISSVRLFKITEMVYQKDEYSTYKFASVFSSVQNLNCGIFIVADSSGNKTEFYMGVRSLDDQRTTKSLKDTLRNSLEGQFPGVTTEDLLDPEAEELLGNIPERNIASVSCVAGNKDEDFNNNDVFLQGLEKFALAMQGQRYTAIILARNISPEQLGEVKHAYETIYTQLSPFANMQLSYGTNTALSISDALSKGTSTGTNRSETVSEQKGKNISDSNSFSETHGTSQRSMAGNLIKAVGGAALGVASILTAPLTGGASLAAAGAIMAGQVGLNAYQPKTENHSKTSGRTHTEGISESVSHGETHGISETTSETSTTTRGRTDTSSQNTQLTMKNKTIEDNLEKISQQLKRIEECESTGMWEGAAYFLADSQETAEMAAGTYRALMRGEKTGVETSAVNSWKYQDKNQRRQLPLLKEYLTSFIHPVFLYRSRTMEMTVTPATLISSNELAIQMGLPRRSICGFPVIEHADFGKEVVKYSFAGHGREFTIGNVFSMGKATETKVCLDCESLTMHTFVTGSTGAGKSNTIYEILNQVRRGYQIPFMVVEPAKGEYKNVFGQYDDVTVYGTNPKKMELLRINPFRFPEDIHVLEHLDRLVEIFNVCWPMYAAMPAILKEGMERAYEKAGWDLQTSENKAKGRYPNFADLLEQIEEVIDSSRYSADSKGDYAGALLTRVRSLTTGLNGLIFTGNDIADAELFDKNVIIDLSRVGSTETKALIMGLLVMKLNEYRMQSGRINSPLFHITVLEEAHNLLKRTSTEQSSEGSNLLGKSVELLTNSIAEMRTYGEGFIIADQSPGLLDMSVIRNTNTKIILRLPEKSDRELVGYAAGLDEEQVDELAKLSKGSAVIYQNDWIDPILIKVNKCPIEEKTYEFIPKKKMLSASAVRGELVRFLLYGRLSDKPHLKIDIIEEEISSLGLSVSDIDFVKDMIREYKESGTLKLWKEEHFGKLSKKITDICAVRHQVEEYVTHEKDWPELNRRLEEKAEEIASDLSEEEKLELCHCLMKDMSRSQDSSELRRMVYQGWTEYIRNGGEKNGF